MHRNVGLTLVESIPLLVAAIADLSILSGIESNSQNSYPNVAWCGILARQGVPGMRVSIGAAAPPGFQLGGHLAGWPCRGSGDGAL